MPNLLTLTASIAVAQVKVMRVVRVTELDTAAARLVVEVVASGLTGIIFPPVFRLEVTNGGADALAAHPAPAFTTESAISCRIGGAGVATAFDTVLAAFVGGGADKFGAVLTALKGISGLVAGGPLNGQTVSILPAGAVT